MSASVDYGPSPATHAGRFGEYSAPRPCACGCSHTDRATYWQHRLAAEERVAGEQSAAAPAATRAPTSSDLRRRVLERTEQDGEPRYYVCGLCAHYWLAPQRPTRCEHCHRPMPLAVPIESEAHAQTFSQAVLDYLESTR